ncbi:MAG: hypothetical protein L6243_00440 [Candidatus Altiarchaeales archaeon]|nr:hypothetical protein [Candidatus Altiarchaeota archaeon]MBU4437518.1 hypothetical protein [Candidatus Altiarchaeota archaeon]MCG2782036.1 hypothetical protein [Candidatus Altiarchaeales archaeon]
MRARLITALALVLIIGTVTAISDRELADMYYQQALDEYGNTSCKNASQLAELALNYYDRAHYTEGKDNAAALIIEINTCLRNQAYNYYYLAFEYYKQGNYADATDFVSRSKELYSLIPHQQGIDSCDGLIAKIDEKVETSKKAYADSLYYQAEDFFISENYITAREYAENASKVYAEIGDTAGVEKCTNFLATIGGKITEIEEMANINYGRAQEYYGTGGYENYNRALEYVGEAKRLYLRIDDEVGAAKAQELVDVIYSEMSIYEAEQNQKAEGYYREARTYYLTGDYTNANTTAVMAHDIYQTFLDLARSTNDKTKMKAYSDKIDVVDELQDRIRADWGKMSVKDDAEYHYDKAYVLFGSGCFGNASERVEKAYELFDSIDYSAGMSKCIVLRERIDWSQENMDDVNSRYISADEYYRSAEYELATMDIQNGSETLREMECDEESMCCYSEYKGLQELNSSIQEGIAKREEADNYYAEAERYFELNNYEVSKDYSIRANGLYKEINQSSGISKSEDLISSNKRMLGETERLSDIFSVGIAVVVISMIIFVILRWRSEKEKREIEERHHVEEEIREKDTTKQVFEEKRRGLEGMVGRERDIVDSPADEKDAVKEEAGESEGGAGEETLEEPDAGESMEEEIRSTIQEAKREAKEIPEE